MSILQNAGRQYVLLGEVEFTFDDFTGNSGVAIDALEVPAGSTSLRGFIEITTAFDSATSDALDVTLGGVAAAAVDAQVVADTALTITNVENATQVVIQIEWTGVGAIPAVGAGRLVVEYMIGDRANENQG